MMVVVAGGALIEEMGFDDGEDEFLILQLEETENPDGGRARPRAASRRSR